MARDKHPNVVELPSAGVPADHGLSSLGLVMQLAGSVLAAGAALLAFGTVFTFNSGGESLWVMILLALSVVRSLFHRMAGTELLYGRRTGFDGHTGSPIAGIRRYLLVAAIHAALFAVILAVELHAPTRAAFGIALGLLAWPLVLGALFVTGSFKRFASAIPVSEDKGFEGAAILMTVLGVCGALATGAILVALFESGGRVMEGRVLLVMLALVMLVVRSCLHVQAGISGLRETSIDRSVELANRYANFGVISAFCAGGALLLVAMTSRLDLFGIAAVAGACWMLMAWPMIIRRFFSDRQFADLLAGDNATLHRRAPDAGLTGLGWLLLAHAMLGASFLIPELVGTGAQKLGRMIELMTAGGARSPWWTVGLVVLQAWAGFEMIRMSRYHRPIAMLYAGVSSAVTLWVFWPVFDQFRHAPHASLTSPRQIVFLMPLAIALVIPISTLILVSRKIAPTARARFRTRATPKV